MKKPDRSWRVGKSLAHLDKAVAAVVTFLRAASVVPYSRNIPSPTNSYRPSYKHRPIFNGLGQFLHHCLPEDELSLDQCLTDLSQQPVGGNLMMLQSLPEAWSMMMPLRVASSSVICRRYSVVVYVGILVVNFLRNHFCAIKWLLFRACRCSEKILRRVCSCWKITDLSV